jgi:hypothetical protein
MSQTTLSVVADVMPDSVPVLRRKILDLRAAQEYEPPGVTGQEYRQIRQALPSLHFMSLTIFEDPKYDPILVMECNFDGESGPFFAELEAGYGSSIREMLRCCKRPPGALALMFDDIVADGSRAAVAPILDALTVMPAIFHHGNRGMNRDRIDREAALFIAVRDEIDATDAFRDCDITTVREVLRTRMLEKFPWLSISEQPLIPPAEDKADWGRLIGFGLFAAAVAALPGLLLAVLLPFWVCGVVLGLLLAWACLRLTDVDELGVPFGNIPIRHWLIRVAIILPVVGIGLSLLPRHGFFAVVLFLAVGLLALLCMVVVTLAVILVWLRMLETRDPTQYEPVLDPVLLRDLARSEDRIGQNHMISIVHLKPGVLRAVLIHAGLMGLGLLLRVQKASREGYLGSMRTIHFAHWAFLSNGGRLMFHSNFDGTWESYLDDFIEKAHAGLTLAWSSSVGFPETRYLVLDGATQGRLFKAWARLSMAPSLFWFSAYPELTVNQIARQSRLADGLRRKSMTPEETEAWALDL